MCIRDRNHIELGILLSERSIGKIAAFSHSIESVEEGEWNVGVFIVVEFPVVP